MAGNRLVMLFVALLPVVTGFYLPGVAPRAFKDGEAVKLKVQTVRVVCMSE